MSKQPFFARYPGVDETRIKALLTTDAYQAILAMHNLKRGLNTAQHRLLEMFWPLAMEGAKAKLLAAGYTLSEIDAAASIAVGLVAPPR